MTTTTQTSGSIVDRLRGLSAEVLKFALVGVFGVVVNFVVFWICLHGLGLASLRSNIAATLVAIGTNYVGYRYWLYRERDAASRRREITLFLVFSGIGMLIETGVLACSVYALGFDTPVEQIAAKVVGLGIGTMFRFFSYRTWVFKALPELSQADAGPPAGQTHGQTHGETGPVVEQAELILVAEDVQLAAVPVPNTTPQN